MVKVAVGGPPFRTTSWTVPSGVGPSLKVMVPVGKAFPLEIPIRAVNVTGWPTADGLMLVPSKVAVPTLPPTRCVRGADELLTKVALPE